MALPNVRIEVGNGNLGQVLQTADGIVALLIGVGSAPSGLALGTPKQVYSLDDVEALGIDEDYDAYAHRNFKQFFSEVGSGAIINFALYDVSTLTKSTVLDSDLAVSLLDLDSDISLLGVCGASAVPTTVTEGIDSDCYLALQKAQILADLRASENKPIRVIVEGNDFNGEIAQLQDLTTMTNRRTAIWLGAEVPGRRADIGVLIGRLSANPVQRLASRVRDGALNVLEGYNGLETAESFGDAKLTALNDKGYNCFRTFSTRAGYFVSNDLTATLNTDDYTLVARGRIMDKAHKIAYDAYLNYLNDEILVDTSGNIEQGVAKTMEADIENAINIAMTANGEISSVRAEVPTGQNVLSTSKVELYVYIVPVGYAQEIVVYLNFENPALN